MKLVLVHARAIAHCRRVHLVRSVDISLVFNQQPHKISTAILGSHDEACIAILPGVRMAAKQAAGAELEQMRTGS
jgi:hypothetical protein